MGVAWEDCPVVAELLGVKLFLNEFVAYQELSQYKQRRLAGAEEWLGDKKQWISVSAPFLPGSSAGMAQHSLGPLATVFVFHWACLRHTEVALKHPYPAILADQTDIGAAL